VQGLRVFRVKHVELDRDGSGAATPQHTDNVGVTGVRDDLGPDPRVALDPALQHDVVEADDKNSVGRARRFEQTRYSVDGEVGPLGLLDLEKDPISSRFAQSTISATVGTRVPANRASKRAPASRLRICSSPRSATKP